MRRDGKNQILFDGVGKENKHEWNSPENGLQSDDFAESAAKWLIVIRYIAFIFTIKNWTYREFTRNLAKIRFASRLFPISIVVKLA